MSARGMSTNSKVPNHRFTLALHSDHSLQDGLYATLCVYHNVVFIAFRVLVFEMVWPNQPTFFDIISIPNKPAIPPTRKPLHGRTITLEPLTAAHSDSLFSCLGGADNATLWDYMPDGPFTSKADFDNFIHYAATSEDRLFFSVMDRTGLQDAYSGKAVGFLSLFRIDVKNRAVEIGFVTFSRMLQRTTAATEVFYLILAFVFDELHFRRCEWKCNDLNVPSKRAATRLGFLFEGVFRKHMIVKGRNRDSAWFSIVDEEWKGGVKGALEKWLDDDNFDADGRQKKDLVSIRLGK
ncbi:hypothetical protein HCAG_04155 [Histoplasma mississippiense (nom. inval.)]|uniref:hypothetical protein n=1 Tax=Ajellomyces capsulatus (strain NAm1 / WU24) TaxID=2059318 RepID=UPI000157C2AB|nr:hypothetical protein HCAG_04155 [Histoplasma mississippiense (nom. inval.)]EDN07645.1 hypothetical protein HCAG_04155 [Histoplasma mississippiense (nom. inval.)]